MNDLWRYDTATEMWTWMSGLTQTIRPASYGAKGAPDPLPTGPALAPRQHLLGQTAPATCGCLAALDFDQRGSLRGWLRNDLWRYDASTWRVDLDERG